MVLKEFTYTFNPQNEYVTATKLRKLTAKVTQGGIESPEFFTGLKIVKIMHFFSLNDLIKTDNGSFTKVAEDLDKLCFKAFPRHNKEKKNLEKTGCHVKKNINDLKVS